MRLAILLLYAASAWAKMPAAYPQTAHIDAFRFYRQL